MSILSDELINDPASMGYQPHIDAGADGEIYTLLHTKQFAAYGEITCNSFAAWATQTGQRAVIEDESKLDSPLRSVALSLLDVLYSNRPIDFGDSDIVAMADAWLLGGKMTQTDYDSLLARASKQVSRAEVLGINPSVTDIAQALRG